MTYDEIIKVLAEGNSKAWVTVEERHCTYKDDPLLTIVQSSESRSFNETWAVEHPDRNATTSEYEVRYGGSLVCHKTLVSVDGGRATLPMPIRNTSIIPRDEYNFAKIVAPNGLDEYIERSHLSVQ